jgi:hypothetical protein
MLHAYLCTICFVFCNTSWRFYAFSRTNLLTRCHSANSLFSTIFVFQKSYTENILGIGRNEARPPIFPRRKTKTEGEPKGGQGPTIAGDVRPPPGRTRGGVGPLAALRCHLSAYIKPPDSKTLNQSAFSH